MLSALARAVSPTDQLSETETSLKRAFNLCPNYERIIQELLSCNDVSKMKFNMTLGVPVNCMLAIPAKSIEEVLLRLKTQEFTCEAKYDGMRAQIHVIGDGSVKIYSRNGENITLMFPDVVQNVS